MLSDYHPAPYEIHCVKENFSSEKRARAVVHSYYPDQGNGEISLSPLSGGATQSTYLFKAGQLSLVIKLFDVSVSLSDILFIFHSYQKSAEMGIGPKIRWLDFQQKALIMDYIEPVETSADLKKALAALKMFHRPIDNEPFATIFKRIEEIGVKDPASQSLFHEALKRCLQMEKAVGPPTAFCHFDFHQNNIIQAGKGTFLIDFDDAGPGHPFYDLAKMTLYASKERKEEILEAYLQRKPSLEENALFFLMEQTAYLSSASNRFLKWILGGKVSDTLQAEALLALSTFLENTRKEDFELFLKICFEQRLH